MSWNTVGFVLIAALAASELVGEAGAATYVVGDTSGWTVPSGGSDTYTTWASQHTFRAGDVLVFNFTTGFHTVAQVTRAAYDACTSTTPILLQTVGPASLTINSTGDLYYICTFGQHCSLGQRLALNVTSPSSTAPPTPALAPPTMAPSPSPPTMAPSPSPPTMAPSSSPSPVSTPPSMGPSGSTVPNSPSPASLPSTLPGDLTPPPSPSSATVGTICMPFVGVVMAAAYGFLI